MTAPEQLGPYRIGEPLGRGGMGTVYSATDTATGETVAVKVLMAALGREEGFRERWAAEIESLRKLRHRNIVRLLGYGTEDDYHYFAMELVTGRSLEDVLRGGRKFEWTEAMELGVQICGALKHAHDRGIIHRDIKPGNLLMGDDGCIKLSDFGIAKLFGNVGVTSAGGVIGTAEYMSPEQADGRPVTHRCDLYSLGGVLYTLMAGRPPFRAKTLPELLQLQRYAEPDPLRMYVAGLPKEVEEIVLSLLQKDPERRIPTALVLSRRLEATRHGLAQRQAVTEVPKTDDAVIPVEVVPSPQATNAGGKTTGDVAVVDGAVQAAPIADTPASPTEVAAMVNVLAADEALQLEAMPRRKFTAVGEHEHADDAQSADAGTDKVWPQTMALAAVLVGVATVIWYAWQPPSADRMYEKISTVAGDGTIEALTDIDDEIDQFLELYPDDERAVEVADYQRQVEENRLERRYARRVRMGERNTAASAIERAYFDAMAHKDLDPAACRRKLQALVDLYQGEPDGKLPSAVAECLTMARRQLDRLAEQSNQHTEGDVQLLRRQLERARGLSRNDPAGARVIWQAIVELYGDQRWAEPLVDEARREFAASAGGVVEKTSGR
jgi:serine/threonine-protein kinase